MSDMDDDELKATRRLNGADKYSEADEMFEKLGYYKRIENDSTIMYEKHDIQLEFYVQKHWVEKSTYFSDVNVYGCKYINMQELQAINKKCEELGWI